MPLQPGKSRQAISANISELTHHGSKKRPRKQIIAIALSNARRTGGGIPKKGVRPKSSSTASKARRPANRY